MGVRSYIQTGNIFFESGDGGGDRAALARNIEGHLVAALGYEVPVFLRTIAEVEQALRKRLRSRPPSRRPRRVSARRARGG